MAITDIPYEFSIFYFASTNTSATERGVDNSYLDNTIRDGDV